MIGVETEFFLRKAKAENGLWGDDETGLERQPFRFRLG